MYKEHEHSHGCRRGRHEAGNNLTLERWKTHHWKVAGCYFQQEWKKNFLLHRSMVSFLCWLLFLLWHLFHPSVTATACERSQSFCPKCRRQSIGTIGHWIQSACSADSLMVSIQPRRAITCVRVNSPKHWQSCHCLDPKVPCTLILVTGMGSADTSDRNG